MGRESYLKLGEGEGGADWFMDGPHHKPIEQEHAIV